MVRISATKILVPSSIENISLRNDLVTRIDTIVNILSNSNPQIFSEDVLVGRMHGLPNDYDISRQFSRWICKGLLDIGEDVGLNTYVHERNDTSKLWGVIHSRTRSTSMPSIKFSYFTGSKVGPSHADNCNNSRLYARIIDPNCLFEKHQEIPAVNLDFEDHLLESARVYEQVDEYEKLYF